MIIKAKIKLNDGSFEQYIASTDIFNKIFAENNVVVTEVSFDYERRIKYCTSTFRTMYDYSNGIIEVQRKAMELGFHWEIIEMKMINNYSKMFPILDNINNVIANSLTKN